MGYYCYEISLCLTLIGYQTYSLIIQVTGGGGYTKENVARCWAVETGVLLDTELPNGILFVHSSFLWFLGEAASSLVILSTHNIPHVLPIHINFFLIIPCIVCSCYGVLLWHFFAEIPNNDYIEYFAPDYTLKVANLNMVKKLLVP